MPRPLRYLYNLIFHLQWNGCPHPSVYMARHYFLRCTECGALMSDSTRKPEGKPKDNFERLPLKEYKRKYGWTL